METTSTSGTDIKINIKSTPERLVIQPEDGKYKYCLVFIHGLLMPVEDCYPFLLSKEMIGLLKDFKIVVPQAPVSPVTIENGKRVYSWFDIIERNFDKPFDEIFGRKEIIENSKTITEIINTEAQALGGDYSKVFLAGFSQGCAMTLNVGTSLPQKLGGIVGIAGYYFEISPDLQDDRNILIIHGKSDPLRPWETVEPGYKRLKDKENVKFVLVEKMRHNLFSEEARRVAYEYIRERAK